MTAKEIKKYCYNKWLHSDKTWNHYLASRLLEKQEIENYE
jgi:hypothetical protein